MAARSTAKGIVPVLQADAPGFEADFEKLVRRREDGAEDVSRTVRRIVDRVRTGGDAELRACIKKFDGATLDELEVQPKELEQAGDTIDPADRAALGKAAMRVREFHRKRIPSSWEVREEGGGSFGHRVRPLQRVGIYVPGGKAAYPSTVIMNAVPASVVEVPEIVMATPPRPDGSIPVEVLMAAKVAGVHRIFKMGGAHAIAALTYGTESVPRVDKIVGPGNVYVATAKRMCFGDVDIDSEAGPTELMVVADRSATPAWVASDLISQAEHDELAQAILVTTAKTLIPRVQDQIAKQLKDLDRAKIARKSLQKRGALVLAKDMAQCIELANRYAPEHLIIATDDADAQSKQVQNAGAIFLGHYTPVAVGDYLAGPNHVLPTGGTARFFSPLGVDDFLKRTSVTRFEPPKLRELGLDVMRLAAMEGLTGHGHSVELRLQKIRRARREREAAREAEAELEL
ncbi:MAG: histidinol dehydrogenase [Deltaproteobacteria bacterium]|jgi:histidinol dehydrogenase|nr:histidinol dehydrogenase [Deltaproteobacteria bacterium]MBW2536993.1 histidinol dehydrogenase [Deltaproteobacteria bacterium]